MSVVCAQPPFCAPRPVIDLSDGALRDATQRTMETADGDVGSTSPYGIDCEDGVVGTVDATVTSATLATSAVAATALAAATFDLRCRPRRHHHPHHPHHRHHPRHYLSPSLLYLSPSLPYLSPSLPYLSPSLLYLSPGARVAPAQGRDGAAAQPADGRARRQG